MARAVYSTRFLAVAGGADASETYTVPAGFIAVVRDIDVTLSGDASALAQVALESPNLVFAYIPASGTASESWQWQGRQVCNEGETLAAVLSTDTFGSIAVSGYLLTS